MDGKASLKTAKRQVKSGEIHTHQYFVCNKKSDNYYNCENGTMTYSILLPLVKEEIKNECSKIVFSKGDLTSIYEQAKESSNSKKTILTQKITKLEKETQKIEKQLEQVYSDKIEGIITTEHFSKFYNLYQEKKENNLQQIKELQKELEKVGKEKVVEYRYIKKIAEQVLNLENIEQNEELLNKLIDRIEYFKGKEIKIKYKFIENVE
ncbi:MAG: hypothetical protein J6D03_01445 [Clostridia bacterium]|nr:hypothetical protein [Clostridia bacterium]